MPEAAPVNTAVQFSNLVNADISGGQLVVETKLRQNFFVKTTDRFALRKKICSSHWPYG